MKDGRSPNHKGYKVFDRMLQEANRNAWSERDQAITGRLRSVAGVLGIVCAIATLAVHFGDMVAAYQRTAMTVGLAAATLGFTGSWAYAVMNGRRTRETEILLTERVADVPDARVRRL